MEKKTADILIDTTSVFYARNAASFSQTRNAPWPGWRRAMGAIGMDDRTEASVLDVACGNLRFEKFLLGAYPNVRFRFSAMDNCEALADAETPVRFAHVDIARELLEARNPLHAVYWCAPCAPLDSVSTASRSTDAGFPATDANAVPDHSAPDASDGELHDLAVCFGFMHHVPTFDARALLLQSLVQAVRPGGYAVVSFWRFMESPKLAAKARAITEEALSRLGLRQDDLDENDYLLGWQNERETWRYCHHFTTGEIDRLVEQATCTFGARLVDRYQIDGVPVPLNEYVVLQHEL